VNIPESVTGINFEELFQFDGSSNINLASQDSGGLVTLAIMGIVFNSKYLRNGHSKSLPSVL
jgi:hypothetical protein